MTSDSIAVSLQLSCHGDEFMAIVGESTSLWAMVGLDRGMVSRRVEDDTRDVIPED